MRSRTHDIKPYDTSSIFKLTDEERIRLGLIKAPEKARTLKIVYPVHVSARAMYYQTVVIPKDDLWAWMAKHPGVEVIGVVKGEKNGGGKKSFI